MSEIARLQRDVAKHDPRRLFSSPRDLVADVMLTRGEKIATLDRWRTMILEELAAANEGMQTRGATGLQTQVLDEIEKVRAELVAAEK